MKSNDIFLAIFIIVVFILCNLVNILTKNIEEIKRNWPLYRCNPLIMPFASYFGHDTATNFAVCIAEMQKGMMGIFTEPIVFSLHKMLKVFKTIQDSLNLFRGFTANLRGMLGLQFFNIFNIFNNFLFIFKELLIVIQDTIYKILGIIVVVAHMGVGMGMSGKSFLKGPIFTAIKLLSFGKVKDPKY